MNKSTHIRIAFFLEIELRKKRSRIGFLEICHKKGGKIL
jgi:hypothetical protein